MTDFDVQIDQGLGGAGWRDRLPSTTAVARSLARPVRLTIHVPAHPRPRTMRMLLAMALALVLAGSAAAASVHSTGEVSTRTLAETALRHARALTDSQPGRFNVSATVDNPLAEVALPPASPADSIPPVGPAPTLPVLRGTVPVGKGMWIWMPERADGGNPEAIVARAKHVGLTHLYVRTGSSRSGFHGAEFLDRLLPVAHAHGIRIYGWDFPYFDNVDEDVHRATVAITHLTPDGHRIDGFAADIETSNEGVNIDAHKALAYGDKLRRTVGDQYPLIAVVPRPNPALRIYPMAEVVAAFDAIAPMVYWMARDPGTDVGNAIRDLAKYNKPVIPVGQTYDGAPEGGPAGVPPREEIIRFMQVADEMGAISVSFWSWQHADQQAWDAIRDAGEFTLPSSPQQLTPGQVRMYQGLLGFLGFPGHHLPRTGVWDEPTIAAVRSYQEAAGLPVTGVIDEATKDLLLTPFGAPLPPPQT